MTQQLRLQRFLVDKKTASSECASLPLRPFRTRYRISMPKHDMDLVRMDIRHSSDSAKAALQLVRLVDVRLLLDTPPQLYDEKPYRQWLDKATDRVSLCAFLAHPSESPTGSRELADSLSLSALRAYVLHHWAHNLDSFYVDFLLVLQETQAEARRQRNLARVRFARLLYARELERLMQLTPADRAVSLHFREGRTAFAWTPRPALLVEEWAGGRFLFGMGDQPYLFSWSDGHRALVSGDAHARKRDGHWYSFRLDDVDQNTDAFLLRVGWQVFTTLTASRAHTGRERFFRECGTGLLRYVKSFLFDPDSGLEAQSLYATKRSR